MTHEEAHNTIDCLAVDATMHIGRALETIGGDLWASGNADSLLDSDMQFLYKLPDVLQTLRNGELEPALRLADKYKLWPGSEKEKEA